MPGFSGFIRGFAMAVFPLALAGKSVNPHALLFFRHAPLVKMNPTVKRLGHIFLIALAVLSLLLCMVSVALWARSHFLVESLLVRLSSPSQARIKALQFTSSPGAVDVCLYRDASWASNRPVFYDSCRPDKLDPVIARTWGTQSIGQWFRLGFGYESGDGYWIVALPYWAIGIAFALGPAAGVWSLAKRDTQDAGASVICAQCGFEMGAAPDCCPRCGTIPKKAGQFST
jgi:hypothetical protein